MSQSVKKIRGYVNSIKPKISTMQVRVSSRGHPISETDAKSLMSIAASLVQQPDERKLSQDSNKTKSSMKEQIHSELSFRGVASPRMELSKIFHSNSSISNIIHHQSSSCNITDNFETKFKSIDDIKWDGSDLGEISHLITEYEEHPEKILYIYITIKFDTIAARCYRDYGILPIILDELKPLFGIPKIGRHRAIIRGKSVLLSRVSSGGMLSLKEIPEEKSSEPWFVDQVRRVYVFRWLTGMMSNFESSIGVIIGYNKCLSITSYKDMKVNPSKMAKSNSIPNTAIKKWFGGSWINVTNTLNQMITHLYNDEDSLGKLKIDICSVIYNFDKNLTTLGNSISSNLLDTT
jgi:hypothetical protein